MGGAGGAAEPELGCSMERSEACGRDSSRSRLLSTGLHGLLELGQRAGDDISVSLTGIDIIAVNSLVEMLRECWAVTCRHQVTTAQVQSQDLDQEGVHGSLCEVSDVCG